MFPGECKAAPAEERATTDASAARGVHCACAAFLFARDAAAESAAAPGAASDRETGLALCVDGIVVAATIVGDVDAGAATGGVSTRAVPAREAGGSVVDGLAPSTRPLPDADDGDATLSDWLKRVSRATHTDIFGGTLGLAPADAEPAAPAPTGPEATGDEGAETIGK